MKISTVAVLLALASSSCSATDSNNIGGFERIIHDDDENTSLRRKTYITSGTVNVAAYECPNVYMIQEGTGFPMYYCDNNCECTGSEPGYTEKNDVGAAFGTPGCYRCSKKDGEACAHDYECELETACNSGTCGGCGDTNTTSFSASINVAASECPDTWTIDPNTGYPTYQTSPDCECTTPGTFKEDVGARFGQPGAYRCSKNGGESCADDFECDLDTSCDSGTCGGTATCPSTPGPGGAPLCGPAGCVCNDGVNTLLEDLSRNGQDCFHCSKPMGASCSSKDECPVLNFNAICFDNKCSVACPTSSHFCGTSDCVCPSSAYSIHQETWPGCFHCVKPDGESCSHFADCVNSSYCINGVCTSTPPDCNPHDKSDTSYDFGQFVNTDSSTSPCGCSDPAYPNLVVIEFGTDSNGNPVMQEGGGSFGYICTNGTPECPSSFYYNDDGMAIRDCQPDTQIGCECSVSNLVKEELLQDCYRCSKPDGATCSDDAECLYGSHCDSSNKCSSAAQNCNRYSGGTYSFGLFWDDDCSGAPCVCGDPAYPNPTTVEFDSNNNIVAGGGYCGYVCTA